MRGLLEFTGIASGCPPLIPRCPGGCPAILLAATRRDARVHPGHARTMAAKLQTMYDVLVYEPAGGRSADRPDSRA